MKKLVILATIILGMSFNSTSGLNDKIKVSKELNVLELYELEEKASILSSYEFKTEEEIEKLKEQKKIEKLRKEKRKVLNKIWKGKTKEFLLALGYRESGNNPKIYNNKGYIGMYQFGKAALITTGYNHVTFEKFKENPSIFSKEDQLDAMIKFTRINYRTLKKYIDKYEGTVIDGIIITKSGILAGAHIGGAGGVIKYLKSNGDKNPSDIYGTSIEDYMKQFSGYDINFV